MAEILENHQIAMHNVVNDLLVESGGLTARMYHLSSPSVEEGKCFSMSLKRARASSGEGLVRAMMIGDEQCQRN